MQLQAASFDHEGGADETWRRLRRYAQSPEAGPALLSQAWLNLEHLRSGLDPLLAEAARIAHERGDQRAELQWRTLGHVALYVRGDWQESARALQQDMRAWRDEAGGEEMLGLACVMLGRASIDTGDYLRSALALREAGPLVAGHALLEPRYLSTLALFHGVIGRTDTALHLLRRARDPLRVLGEAVQLGAEIHIAYVALLGGRPTEALRALERAGRGAPLPPLLAAMRMTNLSWAEAELGLHARAERNWQAAFALSRRHGLRRLSGVLAVNRTRLLMHAGRTRAAVRMGRAAMRLLGTRVHYQCVLLELLVPLHQEQGQWPDALACAGQLAELRQHVLDLAQRNMLDEMATAGMAEPARRSGATPDEQHLRQRVAAGGEAVRAARQHGVRQEQHDATTGLGNLRDFAEVVPRWLPGWRHATVVSIELLNLEALAAVRGWHGVEATVARAATALRAAVAPARLFRTDDALLTVVLGGAAAQVSPERISAWLAELQQLPTDSAQPLHCAAGVAHYPGDGTDALALLQATRLAIGSDGDAGGVRAFDARLHAQVLSDFATLGALTQAVRHGSFQLRLQPKRRCRDNRLVGAEALVRWRRQDGRFHSPEQFVPLAEQHGLVGAIDQWVLTQSCAAAARWQRAGQALTLAVNVSVPSLLSPGFEDLLRALLHRHGLEPAHIELELTETMLIERFDTVLERLQSLRALGVGLAEDDFGAGHASLAYLHRLPVSTLKFDRSFLAGLQSSARRRAMVASIVRLCRALGVTSVAEGIETAAQQRLVRRLGVDIYQGYLGGQPLLPAEFEALWQRESRPDAVPCSTAS